MIAITKVTMVDKCPDCPHFQKTMDGPTCTELERLYGAKQGMIFPEGRHVIHPRCPYKKENRE